jgi:hypothetical protein
MIDRKRIKEICNQIAEDAEQDVNNFDGQAFTGHSVGTQFGNQGASIAALAKLMSQIIDELEEINPTVK